MDPDRPETAQVPAPGPCDGPRPHPVAGQLGHHDLPEGEQEHLRHHSEQVHASVALEHGEELVAALQLLEGDRVASHLTLGGTEQRRFDGAGPARQDLEVPHAGIRGNDDPGTHHLRPPAEVEVLAHGHDGRIEPVELREEVGADQGAPTGGHEDVSNRVVLAVVDLVGLHPLDHRAALVDDQPDVHQPLGIVPAHHLGRDHAGVGPEGLLDEQVDRVFVEGHVVVAEQVVVGPVDHGLHFVRGRAEPPIGLESPHVGRGEHGGDPGREVLPTTSGVEDEHRELGIVLRGE